MCPDGLKFLSRQLKICPDSPKCVRTLQDVSGQFKICPDSSTCVRTVQNMVGRERWLRTFLVCRERDLRVFRPEDFWVPPGRYKVFRPLVYSDATYLQYMCCMTHVKGLMWYHGKYCVKSFLFESLKYKIVSHPFFGTKLCLSNSAAD